MRKLSLDETWKRCMKVWRLVVAKIEAGSPGSVETLKQQCVVECYPRDDPQASCYFCEYCHVRGNDKDCTDCPGRLIARRFDCCNTNYSHQDNPLAFLAKLESLYKKYQAQKGTTKARRRKKLC